MWQEFRAMTETHEWEDAGGFIIERVAGHEEPGQTLYDLSIDLSVLPGYASRQAWRLRCEYVVEHSLRFEWYDALEICSEHTLLWPHTKRCGSLWLAGGADNVQGTINDLFQAHNTLCGEWFDFWKFINTSVPLANLLGGPSGLLATGPENVLEAYAQVLEAHGMRASFTKYSLQPTEGLQLVRMERSFLVCKEATLERVESASGA